MSFPDPRQAQMSLDYEELTKLRKMACMHKDIRERHPAPCATYRFCERCATYLCAACDNELDEGNSGALCDKCFDGAIDCERDGHTFDWDIVGKRWCCVHCGGVRCDRCGADGCAACGEKGTV